MSGFVVLDKVSELLKGLKFEQRKKMLYADEESRVSINERG